MTNDIQIKLHEATSNSDFGQVKQLIESGADVNVGNRHNTPLGSCIGDKWEKAADECRGDLPQLKIIDYLLEHGADPNLPAYGGHTPVALMDYHARPAALKRLLDGGGDPNQLHQKTGETPLHLATASGYKSGATLCVKHLLDSGADPNAKAMVGVVTDNYWRDICVIGETPLHRAAAYGDQEMIQRLIEAGADPGIKDAHGESALTWFSRHQRDKPAVSIDTSAMGQLAYGPWKDSLPGCCDVDGSG